MDDHRVKWESYAKKQSKGAFSNFLDRQYRHPLQQ